jgi:HSP20 family molecular chaperone IbpA
MYEDTQDIFREMDALADHLFARMAHNFGAAAIPQGYHYRIVTRNSNGLQDPSGEPCPVPPRSGSEPIPEVHRIDNEVMVIAELPGATKESVSLAVTGNELIIDADGGSRQYHTTAALPPVDPDSMQTSLKNGVLEVKFTVPAECS